MKTLNVQNVCCCGKLPLGNNGSNVEFKHAHVFTVCYILQRYSHFSTLRCGEVAKKKKTEDISSPLSR